MKIKRIFLAAVLMCGMLLMSSCDLLESLLGSDKEDTAEACDHEWQDATCTTPKTCTKCSETEGEALKHAGGEVVWFKRVDTHYRGYSCCGLVVQDAEAHTKSDGVCMVCGFDPTISGSKVTVSADKTTATVAISVSDNPGIIGLDLTVTFDTAALVLTKAESGSAMAGLNFTASEDIFAGGKFLWDGIDMADKDIKNGDVLILTFDISNAPAGEYLVMFKVNIALDSDMNTLTFKTVSGVITVEK